MVTPRLAHPATFQHPAPLPAKPTMQLTAPGWKALPPRPALKISKLKTGKATFNSYFGRGRKHSFVHICITLRWSSMEMLWVNNMLRNAFKREVSSSLPQARHVFPSLILIHLVYDRNSFLFNIQKHFTVSKMSQKFCKTERVNLLLLWTESAINSILLWNRNRKKWTITVCYRNSSNFLSFSAQFLLEQKQGNYLLLLHKQKLIQLPISVSALFLSGLFLYNRNWINRKKLAVIGH